MLQMFNKIGGALLGIFLYTSRALLRNLILAAILVVVLSIVLIVSPIAAAIIFYQAIDTDKFTAAVIAGILTGILAAIVLPIIGGIGLVVLALGPLRHIYAGAKVGYAHGVKDLIINFFTNSMALEGDIDFAIWQSTEGIQDFFTAKLNDIPTLHKALRETETLKEYVTKLPEFSALTDDETQEAKKDKTLERSLEQYNSLFKRLSDINIAMSDRTEPQEELKSKNDENKEHVEDQLIPLMPIYNPHLLVKYYEYAPSKWKVAPCTSKVFDYSNLEDWYQRSDLHPLEKDSFINPNNYTGYKTIYRATPYKGFNDSHELRELTTTIRNQLQQPKPQPMNDQSSQKAESNFSFESSTQSFFNLAETGSESYVDNTYGTPTGKEYHPS